MRHLELPDQLPSDHPTMIYMVGLPGSGKSTIVQQLMQKYDLQCVSGDQLKWMVYGKQFDATLEKDMLLTKHYRMLLFLLDKHSIVVDDCHLDTEYRDTLRNIAAHCSAHCRSIVMDTPLEECIRRDLQRKAEGGAYVGEEVITRMYNDHLSSGYPEEIYIPVTDTEKIPRTIPYLEGI